MLHPTLITLVQAIDNIDDLQDLHDLARARRAELRAEAVEAVTGGERVRISDTVRPRYLAGAIVTVLAHNEKSVRVLVPNDERYRRFAGIETRLPRVLIAEWFTTDDEVATRPGGAAFEAAVQAEQDAHDRGMIPFFAA